MWPGLFLVTIRPDKSIFLIFFEEDCMVLSEKTKIDDLLKAYPFLMDIFINRSPKFKMLQSMVMRKTGGKVAPLSHVTHIGGIELSQLLREIVAKIKKRRDRKSPSWKTMWSPDRCRTLKCAKRY